MRTTADRIPTPRFRDYRKHPMHAGQRLFCGQQVKPPMPDGQLWPLAEETRQRPDLMQEAQPGQVFVMETVLNDDGGDGERWVTVATCFAAAPP